MSCFFFVTKQLSESQTVSEFISFYDSDSEYFLQRQQKKAAFDAKRGSEMDAEAWNIV